MQGTARQPVMPYRRANKSTHRMRGWVAAAVAAAMTITLTACNDNETSGSAVADGAALTTTSTEPTEAEPTPAEDTDDPDADQTSETTSDETTTVAPQPPSNAPAPEPTPDSEPNDPAENGDLFADDDEWDIDGPQELVLPDEDEALTEEECLLGTWYFSNAVFNDQLNQLAGSVANIDVSGRAKVTFYPDGSVTTLYDAWTMKGDSKDVDGRFTMVRSGTDKGTYTAKDGLMTMQDTSMKSTIKVTIDAAGQVMELPIPPADLESQQVTYMCFPLILALTDSEGYMSLMGRSAAFQ